jgi:hypothetical protein
MRTGVETGLHMFICEMKTLQNLSFGELLITYNELLYQNKPD